MYNGGDWADSRIFDREMQLFLIGFIVIEICEIFTVGGFPLDAAVRKVGLDCSVDLMFGTLIVNPSRALRRCISRRLPQLAGSSC